MRPPEVVICEIVACSKWYRFFTMHAVTVKMTFNPLEDTHNCSVLTDTNTTVRSDQIWSLKAIKGIEFTHVRNFAYFELKF